MDSRLDAYDAIDFGTQAELDVEKARIDTNISAIALNSAKRTYPQSQEDAVTANTAKRSYLQSEEDKVTANSAKRTYPQSQEDAVTANTAKRSYPQSQEDAVTANTAKLTFPTASNTLLHTTHADLHTTHTSQIAAKQDALTGTHLHMDSNGSFIGIGTNSPGYILHIKDSGDPTVLVERASNNKIILNETHFMIVKPANTQFDFNSQGHLTDMVFKSNNLERLRFSGGGGVGFHGVTPVAQHSTNGLTTGAAANTGPAVLLGSAFNGNVGSTKYTISDIVKCLKDLGLLAL